MSKKFQKDSLGNRMKGYELSAKHNLISRLPVIIRLDGSSFHTYLRPLKKRTNKADPFDADYHQVMMHVTQYLRDNIQNAVVGYTQSDEISLLLVDWETHTTEQWFGGSQTKMESISASMATGAFNYFAQKLDAIEECRLKKPFAIFDSRAYNVPPADVCNYFIWRQQDATRNSINALGQHYFSHNELHKLNTNEVQQKLLLEKDINWNNLETWKKRGASSDKFGIDEDIPIFSSDRNYIEHFLTFGE